MLGHSKTAIQMDCFEAYFKKRTPKNPSDCSIGTHEVLISSAEHCYHWDWLCWPQVQSALSLVLLLTVTWNPTCYTAFKQRKRCHTGAGTMQTPHPGCLRTRTFVLVVFKVCVSGCHSTWICKDFFPIIKIWKLHLYLVIQPVQHIRIIRPTHIYQYVPVSSLWRTPNYPRNVHHGKCNCTCTFPKA